MVVTALNTCLELISPRVASEAKHAGPAALFKVGAILSAPEVLVSPPLAEVN